MKFASNTLSLFLTMAAAATNAQESMLRGSRNLQSNSPSLEPSSMPSYSSSSSASASGGPTSVPSTLPSDEPSLQSTDLPSSSLSASASGSPSFDNDSSVPSDSYIQYLQELKASSGGSVFPIANATHAHSGPSGSGNSRGLSTYPIFVAGFPAGVFNISMADDPDYMLGLQTRCKDNAKNTKTHI